MTEEIVYEDNNVKVTTSRIIIGNTTYALRNVTSVKRTYTEADSGCAGWMIGIGSIMIVGLIVAVINEGLAGFDGASIVFTILMFGLVAGGVYWQQSLRDSYHVSISSSSGEAHPVPLSFRR